MSLPESKCSADLFCRSAAFPCHLGDFGDGVRLFEEPAAPWVYFAGLPGSR